MKAQTIATKDLKRGDVICSERFAVCHRPNIRPVFDRVVAGTNDSLPQNDTDHSRREAPFLVLAVDRRNIGAPDSFCCFVETARLDNENQPTSERLGFETPSDPGRQKPHHIVEVMLLSHMQPRWFRAKRDD